MRKVSASKVGAGSLSKGTYATTSRLGSEDMGAEDAPRLAGGGISFGAACPEEGDAALGLSRMGGSNPLCPWSGPTPLPCR